VKPRLAVYSHLVLLTTDPAFPPPTPGDLLRRTRTTYDGPLEIGEDLMSIDVGDEIRVNRYTPAEQMR
jgi:ribonuclease Z